MKNRYYKKVWRVLILAIVCGLFFTGCNVPNPKEDTELTYRKAGIRALQSGDYKAATDSFQKALDNSNGRISNVELDICYYKAYSQIMAGDTKGAMETYDALIDYDDDNGKAYLLRGNLQVLLKQPEKACEDYDMALACGSEGYDWYIYAYEQLASFGYNSEGEKYLHRALNIKGNEKENYRERGRIYLLIRDYASAKEELSKAQNLGDEESKLYMAQVLEMEGKIEEANAIYENYAKMHKGDALACEKLAKVFMEEGKYEEALVYIGQALETGEIENAGTLLKYEIIAYERLGDYAKAKELLKAYMEEFPLDVSGQKELIFLKTR